ncbi:MAG TPA: response regulator transcription factor [Candidatus Sulfotelmatobacter sp.]|jgi:DNA-binding response OmpR family regulator|nr:response regulator transcription factor [Candidatus Sulfotelmatobacter sp.]
MTADVRILVVEDALPVQALLATILRQEGYRVETASTSAQAVSFLDKGDFALVLLDVQLPDGDGLSLARRLREDGRRHGRRPGVIIVSSSGLPEQRAQGLEVGADDYVTKPVFPRELVARVRNLLALCGPGVPETVQAFGRWRLDRQRREVRDAQDRKLNLTPAEYALLLLLADRPGRILSRDSLGYLLGSDHPDIDPRHIDTLVSRIRRKLGAARGEVVETCRGQGYRFTG